MIITGIDLEGFTIKAPGRTAGLPTIGTATVLSNTSANVTFTAPADQGDSAIIGYTAFAYPGDINSSVFDVNANNITITNLTPGTQYTLSVTANNSEAPSGNSQSSNLITTLDVPGPPISQLYRLSHTSANVYYTLSANTGNSLPIALIVQSNTGTILVKNHSISEVSSGNISITGLASNTSQTIQLYANNISGIGSITSLPFFTSLVPDSPTISYVDITSPITANIVFVAPEYVGTGIISFTGNANNIFYSTLVQSGSGNINVTGLSQNTTYSFNVVATSSQGNSSPSSAIASTWGARVIPSPSLINEGGIVTFSAITTNIPTGTTLYWTLNNITTSNVDFTSNIVAGSFIVTANAGSFEVTANSDLLTEDAETFTVSVRSSNVIGTVMATSSAVTITNTSFTQTYAANAAASSINEGSALTINVATTYVEDGVPLYWTINNTTTSNVDFTSNIISGSFTITANVGSFSVTANTDILTEGAETFTVSIRTGSIVGQVVATTSAITINDTSLSRPTAVDYLVVAGGGGGGFGTGGGGGGYRIGLGLPVSPGTPYEVTVGTGGRGGPNTLWAIDASNASGFKGNDSVFSTITATGGGGGAFDAFNRTPPAIWFGGSGGGQGWRVGPTGVALAAGATNVGGTGNTPPTSPSQGSPGGGGRQSSPTAGDGAGGGGGGAGGAGATATSPPALSPSAGAGGIGRQNDFASSGTLVYYAGGGGGGGYNNSAGAPGGAGGGGGGSSGNSTNGTGGADGGANGTWPGSGPASTPTVGGGWGGQNSGGGGGGGAEQPAQISRGGWGGPGIVILRHPTNFSSGSITGANSSITTSGGNVVYMFKAPGTIIFN